MKSIWKFPLVINDRQSIEMPIDAEILCVQTQYGHPCVWALCSTEGVVAKRHFAIYGTGHAVPDSTTEKIGKYVGTFQMSGGQIVFHVFDLGV